MRGRIFALGCTGVLTALTLGAGTILKDGFEGDIAAAWQGVGSYWQSARTAGAGNQAVHRVLYAGTKAGEKPMELTAKEPTAFAGGKFSYEILCSGGSETGVPVRQALALEFLDSAKKTLGVKEYNLNSGPGAYRRSSGEVEPLAGAAFVRPILRVYVSGPIDKTTFVRFDELVFGDDIAPVVKVPVKENTIDLEAPKLDLAFENGGMGWQGIAGGWRITPTTHAGKGALQLVAAPGVAAGKVESVKSLVPLEVRGGEQYRLAAFIRTTDKNLGTKQSIALTFKDAAGKQVGEVFESKPLLPGVNRFTELSELVNVPAGALRADFELKVTFERASTEEVKSYFDSVALQPWRDLLAGAAKTNAPAPAPVKLMNPDSGKWTSGNLSIGKFYQAGRAPAPEYYDSHSGRWTLGSKLTDGKRQQGFNFEKTANVGWNGLEPVSITVDLGTVQQLEKADVSGFQDIEAYSRVPEKIEILTRPDDKSEWVKWGSWNDRAKIGKKDGAYRIVVAGKAVPARFVKFDITPDQSRKANILMLDEIQLDGKIKNTWKMVPAEGVYHGAFPPSYGFKEPLRGGRKLPMSLQTFENLVGKKVSMVLWYQGLSPERNFGELQELRTFDLAEKHCAQRFMSIGWLPPATVSLEDIISGKLDDYFYEYFSDSIDDVKTLGDHTPIWFRPMNEFNSGWVTWGLDPDNFRLAWRRMYNIAEQLGVTKRHIFVWSPNHRSYPDVDWNKMEHYYPGDQYVDWVGVSCYPPSAQYVNGNEDARYPLLRCKEVNDKYGDRKPMMVAEGGFSSSSDQVRWVKEWFEVDKRYPNFKAMIWENHNDRVLQDQPEALKLYRELVKSPRWISETYTGK